MLNNSLAELDNNFNPLIVRNKDSYCVYLPEWRISGVGVTLDEAYEDYRKKFNKVFDDFNRFGLSNLTPEPYPNIKNGEIKRSLTLFLAKVTLSVVIIALTLTALLPIMRAALNDALRNSANSLISAESKDPRYWALKFPADINEKLNKISEEDRNKMFKEWNELLIRTSPLWKPLKCNSKE